MNNANVHLIQRAGEAVKTGDKRQARQLLQQAIKQDATDHIAWLGLARVASSPEASLDYARRAARLKPDDPLVKKVLVWAENKQQPAENNSQIEEEVKSASWHMGEWASWQTAVPYIGIAVLVILVGLAGLWAWNRENGRSTITDSANPTATSMTVLAQVNRSLPSQDKPKNEMEATAVPPTATPNPIQPKDMLSGKEGDPRATWTLTPTPTNTPTPTVTPVPTFVSPDNRQPSGRPFGVGPEERWVDVNLSTQTLTAYEGNTAVFSTLISSGLPAYPTVTGQFRIWLRYESQTMDGTRLGYDYYLTGVPYVMYFYQDYALHGTYWHSNFGTPMSHGCVNLETSDAQWIYNFTSMGTLVNVHY